MDKRNEQGLPCSLRFLYTNETRYPSRMVIDLRSGQRTALDGDEYRFIRNAGIACKEIPDIIQTFIGLPLTGIAVGVIIDHLGTAGEQQCRLARDDILRMIVDRAVCMQQLRTGQHTARCFAEAIPVDSDRMRPIRQYRPALRRIFFRLIVFRLFFACADHNVLIGRVPFDAKIKIRRNITQFVKVIACYIIALIGDRRAVFVDRSV